MITRSAQLPSALILTLLFFVLMLSSRGCFSQVYGSLEVGLRSDSQDDDVVLRQLGFINYQDTNQQTQAVFDYIAQAPDFSDSSISQLYIKQQLNQNNQITAGRFNRFDNLGYYTIDGVQYDHDFSKGTLVTEQKTLTKVSINSYAGKPLRTDDIHVLSGDYVVGVGSHFRWALPSSDSRNNTKTALYEPNLVTMPNDISVTIGYQALKIEQASQRLNLGLSAKSEQGFFTSDLTGDFRQEFNFSSSLATVDNQWSKSEFEDLLIDTRFYLPKLTFKQQDFLQLQYQYYNPEPSRPSFKQRFYSTYAVGKVALAELAYHGQLTSSSHYRVAGRISNKQRGGKGYGWQAQLVERLDNDWQLEASIDHLSLDSVVLSSIYAGISLSPNAYSQFKVQAAIQSEDKPLMDKNEMFGLQGSYQYMFNANLFLSFSLELLRNSMKDNDHLGRLYLVYHFDKEQH